MDVNFTGVKIGVTERVTKGEIFLMTTFDQGGIEFGRKLIDID